MLSCQSLAAPASDLPCQDNQVSRIWGWGCCGLLCSLNLKQPKARPGMAIHAACFTAHLCLNMGAKAFMHLLDHSAGYFGYQYVSGLGFMRKQKSKRAPKRPAREMTPDKSSADEWLKGTHFAQGAKPARKQASNKDLRKAQLQAASAVPTQ